MKQDFSAWNCNVQNHYITEMPAEIQCFTGIMQTYKPIQTHVTLMESSQAWLTLENPSGINKNKGSLFKDLLPIHILLVELIYDGIIIASSLQTALKFLS